ncbi:MAG: efflux RND transporter periplasmic adaptor subunit [Chloroflexota bacterium]
MHTAELTAADPVSRGPLGMNRAVFWTIAVVVLIAIAVVAYLLVRAPAATAPAVSTVPAELGPISGVVNSTGQVAPWTEGKLSFRTSGQIVSIPVRVGDAVKKGDTLASLDTTDLKIQVEQSQANLDSAQAKLDTVQNGPRKEDVAAAQAALDAAQAKLDGMLAGGRAEDIASAQAGLTSAQAKLHELKAGSLPSDLAAAQADVDKARAALATATDNLANLQRPPDPLVVQAAQLAVQQSQDALWSAQASRDGTCAPQNPHYLCDAANATVAADGVALQQAQVKLSQVQEPPKPEDVAAGKAAISSAQTQLASAQVKLAQLKAGPTSDDVTQDEAAVTQAQQALDLKKQPFSDTDIAQQRQAVAQARAQLELQQTPYTASDLEGAKAAVAQAKAQLDLAQYSLASGALTAPFDGIVSAVNAEVGELASSTSGTPIVSLVDPNDLRLDVSVDETDIANVEVGRDANVTFDALPAKTFPGKVVSIAPSASVQQGVATYLVSISLKNAAGVKPGMTGNADIVYAKHAKALLVPNRAVRTEGSRRVVTVLDGTKLVPHPVTVCLNDDQNTEILSGLKQGDQVVMPVTSSVLPPFAGGPGQ